MILKLNTDVIQSLGYKIDDIIILLAFQLKLDVKEVTNNLIINGFITAERDQLLQPIGWKLTKNGAEFLNSVLLESDKIEEPIVKTNSITELATKLKEIFPTGKKEGTNLYWADGVVLIERRLRLFFKKYGNLYTNEQIIQAAQTYVTGFNGNYSYMKLLKYFIFKEKVGAGGEVEGESELINYIENAGQTDTLRTDWTSILS